MSLLIESSTSEKLLGIKIDPNFTLMTIFKIYVTKLTENYDISDVLCHYDIYIWCCKATKTWTKNKFQKINK